VRRVVERHATFFAWRSPFEKSDLQRPQAYRKIFFLKLKKTIDFFKK
jgi:hypothetical protein